MSYIMTKIKYLKTKIVAN